MSIWLLSLSNFIFNIFKGSALEGVNIEIRILKGFHRADSLKIRPIITKCCSFVFLRNV